MVRYMLLTMVLLRGPLFRSTILTLWTLLGLISMIRSVRLRCRRGRWRRLWFGLGNVLYVCRLLLESTLVGVRCHGSRDRALCNRRMLCGRNVTLCRRRKLFVNVRRMTMIRLCRAVLRWIPSWEILARLTR